MSDWYNDSTSAMFDELVAETGVPMEQARRVYSFLASIGLIDYDVEKEIFYARYVSDEEDEA